MKNMRYYIWCDESVKNGKLFSDFYGGILVNSKDFETIKTVLEAEFALSKLGTELKWTKINEFQAEGYMHMMDVFFSYIELAQVKVRIMFTENRFQKMLVSKYERENKFHLLYYQFVKHAFGLKFIDHQENSFLEFFFDKIPDKDEKNEIFKNYIFSLQRLPEFQKAKICIEPDAIAEVESHKHILLQCLDVVLGAMAFRLNKMHLEKPEGSKKRGRRTIAKEKVYKYILQKIKNIYPNFNIGISTGLQANKANLWIGTYRHWRFLPYQWEEIEEK
ncbi:MAG: hypothetical protein EAZ97_02775 [Bacteroidetes bacterium]|nr:MAG: hypothetical protein EAZ97_02775 [Bacteroidota bacterium]